MKDLSLDGSHADGSNFCFFLSHKTSMILRFEKAH